MQYCGLYLSETCAAASKQQASNEFIDGCGLLAARESRLNRIESNYFVKLGFGKIISTNTKKIRILFLLSSREPWRMNTKPTTSAAHDSGSVHCRVTIGWQYNRVVSFGVSLHGDSLLQAGNIYFGIFY